MIGWENTSEESVVQCCLEQLFLMDYLPVLRTERDEGVKFQKDGETQKKTCKRIMSLIH